MRRVRVQVRTQVSGWRRGFRAVFGSVMVVLTAMAVVGVQSGHAAVIPSVGTPTRDGAVAIYFRTTQEFLVLKRLRAGGYDWADDGCSVPAPIQVSMRAMRYAARVFVDECRHHDFAYRNFGGRLGLDRSAAQRAVVDRHFYEQMKRRCGQPGTSRIQRIVCRFNAAVFYAAVRAFGSFELPPGRQGVRVAR